MYQQQNKTSPSSSHTIRPLLSALVHIARGAGLIVKHNHQSKSFSSKLKEDGSDVTEADLMSQKYITTKLSLHFPKLKWIGELNLISGEEDPEEMAQVKLPDLEYPEIRTDLLTAHQIKGGSEEIDYENTVIYIDPLDGTAQFKAGRIQSVTVLIGVSIGNVPKYGVVESVVDSDFKSPVTRFGGAGIGVFRYSNLGIAKLQRPKFKKKLPFRVIVSESMGPQKFKELQNQLQCEVQSGLATGTRIVYLLEHPERCQAYLQKRGPEAQDECAPFALALQLGVIIHNFEGEAITMSSPYNGKRFVAYWEEYGDSIRQNLKQIEHLF